MRCVAVAVVVVGLAMPHAGAQEAVDVTIVGDAVPKPLTASAGDVERGRGIVGDRQIGLCLLCHSGPFPTRFQGDLAPALAGAGSRWSVGQLRLRIVDARHFNADTIMPPYYNLDGLTRVAPSLRGRTLFTAQQVEDVVAFLATLRN